MEVIKTLTIGTIENDKRRLFKAYGTVEQYDRQNELLPISEFRKFMDTWIARGAPIMDGHSNRQIGKGLNWVDTTKDGKPAILITGEIFKDYDLDDKVWNAIKSGKKEGLSIGGTFEKKETTEEGSILRGLTGFEFSVVDRCGNQGAVFTELSIAKGETMADEEKKPEQPQDTPETQVAPESVPEPPKAEAEKTEEKPTEQPADANQAPQDAPAVPAPAAPEESQQKNEQMVSSFNAEASFKELTALITRMDERLNELEDKLSGKPESEEDAKFEERVSEPKEETDKGCGAPEKKEDKPAETEKTQEGVPESEQPDKEQKPKQEMEKQLEAMKKENEELKKSLTVKQVIKAERPSEVSGIPMQQKESYSEIMKSYEKREITWDVASQKLNKLFRGN